MCDCLLCVFPSFFLRQREIKVFSLSLINNNVNISDNSQNEHTEVFQQLIKKYSNSLVKNLCFVKIKNNNNNKQMYINCKITL